MMMRIALLELFFLEPRGRNVGLGVGSAVGFGVGVRVGSGGGLGGGVGGHAQARIMGVVGFLVLDRLGLRSEPEEGAALVSLVFVFGALATLLAQWGLIPRFRIGPRAATLSGMTVAALGTAVLGIGQDIYALS